MKTKIGTGQLFCLFALTRIMYSMLYHTTQFTSGTPLMLGQLAATLIEIALCIPMLICLTRGITLPDRLKWVYSGYFILLLADMLSDFMGFMSGEFPDIALPWAVAAVLVLLWGYVSSLGIEGIARSGVIVFWLVVAFVIAMALVSEGEIHPEYLTPMTKADLPAMTAYGIEELSANWWLPMGMVLCEYTKSSGYKAGIGYLAFKLIFVEALIFGVTVILWQYMNVAEYPILALGAYARTNFIQQFDALNLFFWTLNALIVGGGVTLCGNPTKSRWAGYLVAAIGGGAALAAFYEILPLPYLWIRLAGSILLGVAVPLWLTIQRKMSGR